jgi:hypothetical protein
MKQLGLALPIAFATALIGTGLFAQDAPSPKPLRELFTTPAGVTDTGVMMLNAGYQTARFRDGSQAQAFPTQVDLGMDPWFDLRVDWNGPTTLKDPQGDSQSGGADPLFGGQFQALRQEKAGLDLGLAYWHKLPRASVEKGIGTGKADDTLLLTASRTLSSWEIDMNGGANWLGKPDGGRARQGVISLAVTRLFAPGWNASLDTYALAPTDLGPRTASAQGQRTVTSILAVSRDIGPSLTLDLGVEAGLTRSAERLAVDAGLVWRMGQFWGKK